MPGLEIFADNQRKDVQQIILKLKGLHKPPNEFFWDLQTQIHFQALVCQSDADFSYSDWVVVVRQMLCDGKSTVDDLISFAREHIRKKEEYRTANTKEWVIYVPFLLELDADQTQLSPICVSGQTFEWFEWAPIVKECENDELIKHYMRGVKLTRFGLKSKCYDLSSGLCINKLRPIIGTLKGLFEYELGRNRISAAWPPQKRSSIAYPPWFLGKSSGVFECWKIETDDDYTRAPIKIKLDGYNAILDFSKTFAPEPKESTVYLLICECLRLYSQAMDSKFPFQCLLGFWQLAEAMTLGYKSYGKGEVVCSRLAWFTKFFRQDFPGIEKILMSFYRKRNRIVHHGIEYPISDEEINILKTCCELALEWLIENEKDFPHEENLEDFYRWYTLPNAKLALHEKSLKAIVAERERSTEFLKSKFTPRINPDSVFAFRASYEKAPQGTESYPKVITGNNS